MTQGRHLELAWSESEGHDCLRIHGWSETELRALRTLTAAELGHRLAVLPSELVEAGANLHALQPLAGRFEIAEDAICFLPRFPFLDGMSYTLLIGAALGERVSDDLEVWTIQRQPRAGAPTTEVVAIYPSATGLPVNQLKLYIHFSSPMSEGWAYRAVHVRRADNDQPLEGVFLAMELELWDQERRRLTLLLDPGRIKRGLVPSQEAGYPLIEGVPVIISVDAAYRDASARPLRAGAERRYGVGPPVRVRVDPRIWRRRHPAVGSLEPLIVDFDRPLDQALLEHCLWVNKATGEPLAGRSSVGPGELCWRFEPQSPWGAGHYSVIVDPRLEDLAGNSIIRVFDRDLMRTEDTPADAHPFEIDFTCVPTKVSS